MTSGGLALFYFILIFVLLCINGYLASNASDIANEKGYEKRKWFHMCFWLGPISYIIIASMPDKVMRDKQDETNQLLAKVIESLNTTTEKEQQTGKDDGSSYLPEL